MSSKPCDEVPTRALPPLICRMIFDELCVLANGDIVCSCGDPAGLQVYGNVYRDRIEDVYNGPLYQQMRRWQLQTHPTSYCPVVKTRCGGRVSRATSVDTPTERAVRMLQIEPIARCNLRCPSCPATQMSVNTDYKSDRATLLPLPVMLDVVSQLPYLEKILFYNFGEPFMHPEAISFLQEVRRQKPDVLLHTNTNGLLLTRQKIETIVNESLLDRCVFSIDGAWQKSYEQYRINGDLTKALRALEIFAQLVRTQSAPIEVHWQYILFEWNDSDEELSEARQLAVQLGVPIKFIVTHTPGASKRFKDGDVATFQLFGQADAYEGLTCDSRMQNLWRWDGIVEGRYLARISQTGLPTIAGPKELLSALVTVRNESLSVWEGDFRLAAQLRTTTGRSLTELSHIPLPASVSELGGEGQLLYSFPAPSEPGTYELFLDVVEQGVCWFSERSSPPLVVRFEVQRGNETANRADLILEACYRSLLCRVPDAEGREYWRRQLDQGLPLEIFLAEFAQAASRERPEALDSESTAALRRMILDLLKQEQTDSTSRRMLPIISLDRSHGKRVSYHHWSGAAAR